jgi:hypothetical protein
MKNGRWPSFLLGLCLFVALGITTDQILQTVYDSTNTALRVNLVAGGGGGTITGSGTAPDIAAWSSSSALTNYPGSACTPPALALSTSAAGVWTCATPIPGAAQPTATPLAFGTPGVLAAFAATELGAYPGAACTPPALALSTDASGAWTCATPVPPTPLPTATPQVVTGKQIMAAHGNGANAPSNSASNYIYYLGEMVGAPSASDNQYGMVAIAGTLKNLICYSGQGALTSTQTWTLALHGAAAGDLACLINSSSTCGGFGATGTCCTSGVNTIAVAATSAGTDYLSIKSTPTNTPATSSAWTCGWEFDPS